MCTLAARHNALPYNPVRDLGTLRGKPKKAPAALTVAQLRQLRAALTYDDQAVARDLPDLVRFLMATGLRIGEAAGLAWRGLGRRRPEQGNGRTRNRGGRAGRPRIGADCG
jgi:integrase